MSFWWMEPCIYRTMAEHCSWDSSLTCDESMWFTCGDDVTERVLICFTIKATRDTSAIVEVFSSEPVGGDIARNTKLFLLKWIIIFLIHDLKSSKIDGWGKHAERPFLTYLDGEVSVCEIPGWKVGTIRHKDDRDKWKYHL